MHTPHLVGHPRRFNSVSVSIAVKAFNSGDGHGSNLNKFGPVAFHPFQVVRVVLRELLRKMDLNSLLCGFANLFR